MSKIEILFIRETKIIGSESEDTWRMLMSMYSKYCGFDKNRHCNNNCNFYDEHTGLCLIESIQWSLSDLFRALTFIREEIEKKGG